MYKTERRVALHFVRAGLSTGVLVSSKNLPWSSQSFVSCLVRPCFRILIRFFKPAIIYISKWKPVTHAPHLFTHYSKMLFTSVISVAVLVAGLNAAPVKLQKRQAPAGVPDFVIKYGKQLLFSSTIQISSKIRLDSFGQ